MVGVSFASLGGATRPFTWRAGTITDLNTVLSAGSPWVLTAANDINDLGQIAGYGRVNGVTRAFILTPPRADRIAGVTAFVRALQAGAPAFERRAVSLLAGGRCARLRKLATLVLKQRRLSRLRRNALAVRVSALRAGLGC